MNTNLTEASQDLFNELAQDAGNWNGQPLFQGTKEEKGNLTDLKKHGLIETCTEDGCCFVLFTSDGVKYAAERGYTI